MPSLKQLSCAIEWPNTDTKFPEHGTVYGDGVVETFIVIPYQPQTFSIHITSKAYINEGLSVIVFIDGEYQCNRNRVNLKPFKKGQPKNLTEIDFRLRQKEKTLGDGTFLGREWRFDVHNIEPNVPIGADTGHFESLGNIEVIVLRCKVRNPLDDNVSTISSGADANPLAEHVGLADILDDTSLGSLKHTPPTYNEATEQGNVFTEFGAGMFDGTNDEPDQAPHFGGDGPFPAYHCWHPYPAAGPGMYPMGQQWSGYPAFHPGMAHIGAAPQEAHNSGSEKRVHFDMGGEPNSRAANGSQRQNRPSEFQAYPTAVPFNAIPPHFPPHRAPGSMIPGQGSWMHYPWGPDPRYQGYGPGYAHYPPPYYAQGPGYMSSQQAFGQMNSANNQTRNESGNSGSLNPAREENNKSDSWGNENRDKPVFDHDSNENEKKDSNTVNDESGQPGWGETITTGGADNQAKKAANENWVTSNKNSQDGSTNWANNHQKNEPATNDWNGNNQHNEQIGSHWNDKSQNQAPGAWPSAIIEPTPGNAADHAQPSDQRFTFYGPHGPYYAVRSADPLTVPAECEEEPIYNVPEAIAHAKGSTHQVQPGRGYLYWHKRCTPEYVDPVEEPYARFIFKYRTKEQLEREIGIKVDTEPSGDAEIQDLQSKDKQEIIDMLLRAKSALGGKIPDPAPKLPSTTSEVAMGQRQTAIPPPNRSFLKYSIPLRNGSIATGLGITGTGGGGDGGGGQMPPQPWQGHVHSDADWGNTPAQQPPQQNGGWGHPANNWGSQDRNQNQSQSQNQQQQPVNSGWGSNQGKGSFGDPGGPPPSVNTSPNINTGASGWNNGGNAGNTAGGASGW